MPIFRVQSPDGREVELEGDVEPSESDLDEIFQSLPQPSRSTTGLPAGYEPMPEIKDLTPPTLSPFTEAFGFKPTIMPTEPQPVDFTPEVVPSLWTEVPKQLFTKSPQAQLDTENALAVMPDRTPFEAAKSVEEIDRSYQSMLGAIGDWTGNPEKIAKVNALKQWRDERIKGLGFGLIDPFATPKMERLSPQQAGVALGINPEGRTARNIANLQGTVAGVAEGFIAPEGAAMFGPKAIAKPIATAFIGMMSKDATEQTISAIDKYADGDTAGGDAALVAAAATASLLGLPLMKAKGPDAAKELAKQIERAEFNPRITPEAYAEFLNRLPKRATPEMLPELQRTKELVDQAVQEAQQRIVEPGRIPAIEQLKAQGSEIVPSESRVQKPDTRFERPAEEVMRGRTVAEKPMAEPPVAEPAKAEPASQLGDIPTAAEIKSATPEQVVEWKRRVKYGPETSRAIADKITDAEALEMVAERDLLRDQSRAALREMEQSGQLDQAKMEMAQQVHLKAQTLNEIIQDRVAKGKPAATPESPKAAEATPAATEIVIETPKDIITKLQNLKVDPRKDLPPGQTFSLPHPDAIKVIGKQLWNDAIDVAIAAVKAGRTIKAGIAEAIAHIKRNARNYDETKIRQNLESVLKDEGLVRPARQEKAATAEVPPKAGSGIEAAKRIKAPTLEDVYKIFEPETAKKASLKERVINIAEGLRTGLSSKFRPLNKLAEDIAKSYGLNKPKDIAGVFEALKGSQGKGEAEIYRFDRDVSRLVEGSEKDFNAYMFLRRSIDRLNQDIATGEGRRSVADYSLGDLQSNFKTLESKLGPEKMAQFEKAANEYQRYLDTALNLQVESGRMSREVYNAIKKGNQFYAPFKVMKYIEETSRPSGTGKQIDTAAEYTKAMKGIEDADFKLGDMLGAARQSILMSRILADKNQAMRMIAELAPMDVNGMFIKRLGKNSEAPRGWDEVGVMENGERVKYAVNKDVADAVSAYGETGAGVVGRILSAFSVPFKAGATALNIPFQVSNLLADQPRAALISKYGIHGASDLIRYPLDFVHSLYSSVAGDMLGRDNKLFRDFLDSGVAGGTVQEALTPEALKFHETTGVSKSKKIAESVLYSIPNFAKAIEQTSKVMGVKRAMRFEGVESGAELATQFPEAITELRRFSGSPDFGRQGKVTEQARLNLLYMFLNARIQGAVADLGRLTGRDGKKTAAQTWAKVGYVVGLPSAYLWYLNNNDENREDFEKRPKQERQNYWLIPKHDKNDPKAYITTEDGEKVRDYWRIPKRESAKWLSNLTETALDFARHRDPVSAKAFGVGMIEDISPVNVQGNTLSERMESVGASLNPLLKAPLEVATGRDMYRHRNIVPDKMKEASPEQQYTDRTPEVFKKLANLMPDVSPEFLRSPLRLENLTKNLTAGLVTQFLPSKPVEGRSDAERNPLLQRFQSLPFTEQQKFRDEYDALRRQAADESLARNREAQKLLDANKGKSLEEIIDKIPKNKEGFIEDRKFAEHVVDAYIANQAGITPQEKLILGLPIEQRAKYVANQIESANPEDRPKIFDNLVKKKILTKEVYAELPQVLK